MSFRFRLFSTLLAVAIPLFAIAQQVDRKANDRYGTTEEKMWLSGPQALLNSRKWPLDYPEAAHRPQNNQFNFQDYAEKLRSLISKNLKLSANIIAHGASGTSYVEFTLKPDGTLVSSRIYKTSGNALLDQAALRAVNVTEFPPFKGTSEQSFAIPIAFAAEPGRKR